MKNIKTICVIFVLVSSCSSPDDSQGIISKNDLSNETTVTTIKEEVVQEIISPEDAQLLLARCLRDKGYDINDPKNPMVVGGYADASYTHDAQIVNYNGTDSDPLESLCGVPQGSVLGPLLFLLYINDLPSSVRFESILFADDTTFQISADNLKDLYSITNIELKKAHQWFNSNLLTLHVQKTNLMIFAPPNKKLQNNIDQELSLSLDGEKIDRVGTGCQNNHVKFVGLSIDDKLSWEAHK